RARLLPPHALLARLDRRLPVLVGGPRDHPEHQRSLRRAIAWSHDLLDADERAVLRRLGVLVGEAGLDAAVAVAGAGGRGAGSGGRSSAGTPRWRSAWGRRSGRTGGCGGSGTRGTRGCGGCSRCRAPTG